MEFLQQNRYPRTFNLVKKAVDFGENLLSISNSDKQMLVSTFLDEIDTDELINLFLKDKIKKLVHNFLFSNDDSFKEKLFSTVFNEYKLLFDELFDEARENNLMNEIESTYHFGKCRNESIQKGLIFDRS